MSISPRDLLRQKGTPYAELGLDDISLSVERLINAMLEHPILINRPIMEGPRVIRHCQPSAEVLAVLN